MILFISMEELEPEFKLQNIILRHMRNVGIDYETNAIDGLFNDKEYCLFKFSKYDIKLSNRWNDYKISHGETGITIEFISTGS